MAEATYADDLEPLVELERSPENGVQARVPLTGASVTAETFAALPAAFEATLSQNPELAAKMEQLSPAVPIDMDSGSVRDARIRLIEQHERVTSANFAAVTTRAKPVLIELWTSHCPPCLAMAPIVDDVANELDDRLDVAQLNCMEDLELTAQLDVASTPMFLLFHNGEERLRMFGPRGRTVLLRELTAALSEV